MSLGHQLLFFPLLRKTHRQSLLFLDLRLLFPFAAAIILGGGAGTRLYPLTKQRAKPAVPIGGAYRLIDVPMSNCINSGISKIYILTQFNSTSLNRHLARTYNMGSGVRFGGEGFVEVLAATQVCKLG
jgi:glucose-1-phosphate adenylyltransferase